MHTAACSRERTELMIMGVGRWETVIQSVAAGVPKGSRTRRRVCPERMRR